METQMKTQGKKRLSPAKGHVCIWNASMPAKSSKSRVLITAASPSPSAMTRVWRLGASIASVPKPKKFLPASQYLFYFHGTFFNPGFLFCSCNNFAECHILAEDFDFGPNPCPDTERYLEASYVCVPRSQNYDEGKNPFFLKKNFLVANAVKRKDYYCIFESPANWKNRHAHWTQQMPCLEYSGAFVTRGEDHFSAGV